MELSFPKIEQKILKFWKENGIFEKSISQRKKAPDFIFYEGPPTANGKPGIHHVLSRVFKDIICRYKTMRGFRVLRKAGWDTHGLPVELEIEKKLGFKSKKDIEKYGIAKFNKKCRESVWKYKKDWENLTERIGYWLDMKNPYITYATDYIETLWRILKEIWRKNLLYQDFKVVPYCPRCGTSLSSHEVALGYQKVKETAIYVKFPIKNPEFKDASLLVWTTTPWTLPGNVAVAINPNFSYAKVKVGKEYLIIAKERLSVLGGDYEIIKEFKGKELVGLAYQPLFDFYSPEYKKERVWETIPAGFVSLEEGTGLVHIAPAFGEEDMEAIKAQNEKLKAKNLPAFPILLTVDDDGRFALDVKKWAGMFVKDADPLIAQDLKNRGLLFKEELYEHDYPFCWRCHSPLLYYAKKSWFIGMEKIKKDLIENNQKINWVPSYLKEGRFGGWLKEAKDWAISRERYWGTPLPVWQCRDCQNLEVIGSLRDLLSQRFSQNNYFVLRHGESIINTRELASCWPEKIYSPLTEKGEKQIWGIARELKAQKIDLIFSSDILRTKQTAKIVGKELGIKPKFDKRLRDVNVGILNGKPISEAGKFWAPEEKISSLEYYSRRFEIAPPGGENYHAIEKRMWGFLKEIEEKHQGKNILIVSHKRPLTLLDKIVSGYDLEKLVQIIVEKKEMETGELRGLDFKKLPYNEKMELDFHRPYIDEVKFFCPKCSMRKAQPSPNGSGRRRDESLLDPSLRLGYANAPMRIMVRVPEVIDCWFDSGAMPFAQGHWPFDKSEKRKAKSEKLWPPELFPADYISEAIDQTRGWFYTLLAISTLMGFSPPYKNVISLGHVLDEKGEKMSKSKGNVVDPWYVINKYGIDAARWYFYTINQPGEPKLFSEKDIDQTLKKFILTFWNCFIFYNTYAEKIRVKPRSYPRKSASTLLDRWVISKLNRLVLETTNSLDNYDVTRAARAIENFVINDLSLWYVRRSRRRFQKPENEKELVEVSKTLGFILLTLSKIAAPFIPFLGEYIYQKILNLSSVHLADWPKADKKLIDEKLNQKMDNIREIVSLALAERARASIKVRQPLSVLKIRSTKSEIRNNKELLDLVKDEVNVKEVIFDAKMEKEVELDTEITPELKEEGMVREVIRHIQDMRKGAGLKPGNKINVQYSASPGLNKVLAKNKKMILREANLKEFLLQQKGKEVFGKEKEVKVEGERLWIAVKKS